jgi:hypothetical protein
MRVSAGIVSLEPFKSSSATSSGSCRIRKSPALLVIPLHTLRRAGLLTPILRRFVQLPALSCELADAEYLADLATLRFIAINGWLPAFLSIHSSNDAS